MAISIREKNREPGWFAAFWRTFSSPSFAGVTMILAAAVAMASSILPDSGLIILGRVVVFVALGSLLATTIGVLARPRYFGRAMTALGMERRIAIPVFRQQLKDDQTTSTSRRIAVFLRLAFFALTAGVPLVMVASALFDQTLSGEAVITSNESVESVGVSLAGTPLRRDLAMALKLGEDVDIDGGIAELIATNKVTAETERPVLRVGERLHLNSEYVALSGWRPTLSTRSALFEVLSDDGDVLRGVSLQDGSSVDLVGGGSLELLETRDAFLELLGPAARVRITDLEGVMREFWTFTRAPDFDLRHGTGSSRVRLLGFEPGTGAVVRIRNTSGQRWDLWAAAFFGALALLLLARSLPSPFLTGQSGDYLYISPTPWFFTTETVEAERDVLEDAVTRPESARSGDTSSPGEGV